MARLPLQDAWFFLTFDAFDEDQEMMSLVSHAAHNQSYTAAAVVICTQAAWALLSRYFLIAQAAS